MEWVQSLWTKKKMWWKKKVLRFLVLLFISGLLLFFFSFTCSNIYISFCYLRLWQQCSVHTQTQHTAAAAAVDSENIKCVHKNFNNLFLLSIMKDLWWACTRQAFLVLYAPLLWYGRIMSKLWNVYASGICWCLIKVPFAHLMIYWPCTLAWILH